MLAGIIGEAKEFRAAILKSRPEEMRSMSNDSLFVNLNGRPWNRMTLLHAAQRAWLHAGLEAKKIHEIRHTLGTLADREFPPGMVQAVMRHRSRKSSETYFHPNEDMAAEVRKKLS